MPHLRVRLPADQRRAGSPVSAVRRLTALALAAAVLAGCGEQLGPSDRQVQVAVVSGARLFAQPGTALEQPLEVLVTDAATRKPVANVNVTWRIAAGAGTVAPSTSTTDDLGVAWTELRLQTGLGGPTVRVEATAPGNVAAPAAFEIHLVEPPAITGVAPTTIEAGATVTIDGRGFLPDPADNAVLFGGVRGTVTSARPDRLVVTAPRCLQSRSAELRVLLGQVASEPAVVQTVSQAGGDLLLARGQGTRLVGADIECVRFGAAAPGALYLAVAQNAAETAGTPIGFELLGSVGAGPVTTLAAAAHRPGAAHDFELAIRARERAIVAAAGRGADVLRTHAGAVAQPPRIGDRRQFNVLNSQQKSDRVNAEVRAVSARAVMYVDVDAPANGFTDLELKAFGTLFDDPIYPTEVDVFGQPTDVDGNGLIIILFTPRVNALTARGEDGFVAGYFYGCDLVLATRCADTNRAEIFYSMVPDPDARFGDRRTKGDVLRTVPGILAHEFQHMIHFGRRDALDVLWLSEGLAHAAEDLVGRVFRSRGDEATAEQFRLPNLTRAHRYLLRTSTTSLIAETSPGTLELRGGAWLFVEYLAGLYGGDDLLGRLSHSALSGIANVRAQTGEPWDRLLSDFGVALWADDAPELAGATVDRRFTMPRLDLRAETGRFQGGFALRPDIRGFQDFVVTGTLATAAHAHLLIQSPLAQAPPFSLAFTGIRGGTLAPPATPQLTILRVR